MAVEWFREYNGRCLAATDREFIGEHMARIFAAHREPITLEENVWIGGRSIILGGVTIGADSAIGAGSVVVSDVPPRTLAAGVPARVIREL